MSKRGHNNNYERFNSIISDLKNHFIACTDIRIKQYILYFLCLRARLWGIRYEDLMRVVDDISSHQETDSIHALSVIQFEQALDGYSDCRKISNKRFSQVTGIKLNDESLSGRESLKHDKAIQKANSHIKRVELLKRLVRRKPDVTINDALEHFEKHNVGIGSTKFHNTPIYKIIMSDMFIDGEVKVRRNGDGYKSKYSNLLTCRP